MTPPRPHLLLAAGAVLTLAGASGALDAIGFLVAQVFTGNQTGNLVIMSMTLVGQGPADAVALSVVAFLGFLAGMLLALAVRRGFGSRAGPYRAVLFAEGLAIVAAAVVAATIGPDSGAFIPLLAVAQGIQGIALASVLGVGVRTVVITGSILDVGRQLADRRPHRALLAVVSPVGYAIGAVVAVLFVRTDLTLGLGFAAVACLAGALQLRRLDRVPGAIG